MGNPENSFKGTAVAVALWAAVLIAAFFSYRGPDVGRLGELVGNLGGGPLAGPGIVDAAAGSGIAFIILLTWLGLGSVVWRFIPVERAIEHSHVLELAMKIATGAALWSLIWFFLGVAGAYDAWAAVTATVIGLGLNVVTLARAREAADESRVPEVASGFDRLLLLLIAVPTLLAFVASLAPPTAKDTLLYHFAVPKAFIAQGSSSFVEGNIASYLALGTEMHTVWAMILGGMVSPRAGEAAAGATVCLFFPVLLAAIFGFAREIGVERRWALIAVLMVAAVPTAYHVAASAYIDLALALFVTLAIYALTRWWRSLDGGWLVYVAIFLGAALSAKLTALFVFAAFALVILLRVRQAQANEPDRVGKIAGLGFGALFVAGIIASPWYIRTWDETGSPIFPFYLSIWEGQAIGWDIERSNLFQEMNAQYGGYAKTSLDYIAAPWNISVTAQPELATHFDGVLGVAFLIGLPILIWALWKFEMPAEVKMGAGVAAVMFIFWLFSSQQLRYLLPIIPVLAIGIAMAFQRIGETDGAFKKTGAPLLTAAAIAGMLVSAAWFLQKAPLRVTLGGETRADYLARNIDYYPYYRWLNEESAAETKVWLINMRRDTYHLDRPYYSDYLFEDWTLRKMLWESNSVEELRTKAGSLGVTHILTRHDFLFDPKVSPIVDDAKPAAENMAKMKLARDFLLENDRRVKADNRFSLVRVF